MEKSRRLAAAVICTAVLLLLRTCFTATFFVPSVICIIKAGSRIERCEGRLGLSQRAINCLNTTSTFLETIVSCFLIFLIYRWKTFNFKNFLRALVQQAYFWMWTALWVARIITNVLIAVIPGINENNPVLVVLGFSVPLEFASTTMLACALSFVQLSTVRNWFTEHFPRRGRDEKLMYLYRITLFSYGLRMLALFLYDSFLVARAITRERQFRELDSLLLALDVGYRGSLTVFFFRKFFEFENTPEVFLVTTNSSKLVEVECQSKAEGQEIETYGEIFENEGVKDMKREEKGIIVASGKTPKDLECSTQI
ncbi:hypothetical protein ABFA07_005403 [Porites harrisoni]